MYYIVELETGYVYSYNEEIIMFETFEKAKETRDKLKGNHESKGAKYLTWKIRKI